MKTPLRQNTTRSAIKTLFFLSVLSVGACRAALIGHWTFDEGAGTTAVDSAGHHDGTIQGATYIPGRIGAGALHFTGSSSYVMVGGVGTDLELTNTPYTIACWVRWSGDPTQVQVLYAKDDGVDYSGGYNLYIQVDASPNYRAAHNTGNINTWVGGSPAANAWKQVIISWNGTNRNIYVDGSRIATTALSQPLKSDGNDPLVFGGILVPGAGVTSLLRGDLDDIRIYNNGVNDDQAMKLYLGLGVTFHSQPIGGGFPAGQPVALSVDASANSGSDVLQYQWRVNGVDIEGATNKTYTTPPVEVGKTNDYSVIVIHDGSTTSSAVASVWGANVVVGGLIGHWDFEEASGNTAIDSALGENGIIVNATRIAGISGSGALHFNGTNAYVFVGGVGTPLELTNTAYSVAWWQRWNGSSGRLQTFVAKDNAANHDGGYQFYIESIPQLVAEHNSGANQDWFTGIKPDTNWQHFCVTWDLASRSLYINGRLTMSRPTTTPIATRGTDPLIFGAINAPCCGGIIDFLAGDLDDIRIYNRAISAEEIKTFLPAPQVTFIQQPVNLRIGIGSAATFKAAVSVVGGSQSELQFQWKKDGVAITNATNISYTTPVKTSPGTETYTLDVASGQNHFSSNPATLEIIQKSGQGRLISQWGFEEGSGSVAHDSAGSNNGIIDGAQFVPGRVGNWALDFNGVDASVLFPTINEELQLVGTSYTIAWWQKYRARSGVLAKVISMDDGLDQLGGYSIGFTGNTFQSVHGAQSNQVWNLGLPTNTNWTHYALVWNGITRQLYINGKLTNSISTQGDLISDNNDSFSFGSTAGTSNFFSGSLDDVEIFDYALTGSEVAALVVFPVLYVQEETTGLRLSWYVSGSNVYRVESTTSLNAAWTPVSSNPLQEGEMMVVHLAKPQSTMFFRLRNLN